MENNFSRAIHQYMKNWNERGKPIRENITLIYNCGKQIFLRGFQCALIVLFLTSCAPTISKIPQQKFLLQQSLSGISRVVVVVMANDVDVYYHKACPDCIISPILSIIVQFRDSLQSKNIRDNVSLDSIKEKLAQSFIQPLQKVDYFQTIDYVTDWDRNTLEFADKYDAVIRLSLNKLLLEKVAGGDARLRIDVRGEMEALASGNYLWNRQEIITSPTQHSLDEYKSNGLQELDMMLDLAGKRLSNDFVYIK